MNKATIFLSLSFSIAIRNFFETGVIEKLQRHFNVVILATPRIAATLRRSGCGSLALIEEIDVGREPVFWRWLRHFRKKVYMEGRQSATEAIWQKYHRRPLYQRIGGVFVRWVIKFVDPIRLHSWIEQLEARFTRDDSLRTVFEKHRPRFALLCITMFHHDEVVVRNCRSAGVPMAYMVMSWDHLSAKVVLHLDFSLVLVWNEYTRQETLRTYPWFKADQIKVVGIPNYDLYAEKPSRGYTEWCRDYGLDPTKRTILFSTMPQSRHEQQHVILARLLDEIERGQELPSDLQILIKCHPFDNFEGYENLARGRPAAVHRTSFRGLSGQENWEPSPTEIRDSRDALYHCALNINIFSTVTIEAAYFDKPVVSIAFDPLPLPPGRIPCREYYNWDHFRHIVEKDATLLVESYAELFSAIRAYLHNPSLKAAQRRTLVQTYIGGKVGEAGDNLVNALVDFSRALDSRPDSMPGGNEVPG